MIRLLLELRNTITLFQVITLTDIMNVMLQKHASFNYGYILWLLYLSASMLTYSSNFSTLIVSPSHTPYVKCVIQSPILM